MKNVVFRSADPEVMARVMEEYQYIGREVKVTGPGELTIYGKPQKRRD